MAQVFQRSTELYVKLAMLALLGLTLAFIASLLWPARSRTELDDAVAQPIPFSHKHHVGDIGIDCRYCHTSVESSPFAGMPSTQTCLTCHSQLFNDQAMLAPLRASNASGMPIPWHRVHMLPDFVFFDHSIHIAKGVPCMECHGRVDQMPLMRRVQSLQMEWCLACHRDPAPHLRRPEDVFKMGEPPLSDADAQALARLLKLQSTARLTDCSTCHR